MKLTCEAKKIVVGALSVMALFAFADDVSTLEVARSALRDGLWQIARHHAERIDDPAARLIILESYASENRWADVKSELAKGNVPTNDVAFAYYEAVVDGRYADAIECLKKSGSQAGKVEAKMLEADLLVKLGKFDAAKALWMEVLSETTANTRAYAYASLNLGDVTALRESYTQLLSVPLKRRVGLRLGRQLLTTKESEEEGSRLIRAIVTDAPDAEGAVEAFLDLAAVAGRAKRWKDVVKIYADAIEIWPQAVKRFAVQEGRAEAYFRLGRLEEALDSFTTAEALATDDPSRARTILRQGDVLSDLGRGADAMMRYRAVLEKYPETETAVGLKRLIDLRELETKGRDLYHSYQFAEAAKAFTQVAEADPTRKARMDFLQILCLYGRGLDTQALVKARQLAETCEEENIRAEAILWLAKLHYNQCDWKASVSSFMAYQELRPATSLAPVALLWAARAAFASSDFAQSIQIATKLVERYPSANVLAPALLVQAEALVEMSRYDEAILVLDRVVIAPAVDRDDRLRARLLKADALFAMGADNPVRYQTALEAYRVIQLGDELDADQKLSIAFKIGRVLEKLKRPDEATEQYYTQVVLAYRDGRMRGERYGDKARAAFSRAAFRLADEFEDRGRDYQAVGILKLVVESGVPAAEEAERRISRIYKKGLFL